MGFKTCARQFFYCILCGSMVEYSPIVLTYIMLHVCLNMVILSDSRPKGVSRSGGCLRTLAKNLEEI